MVKSKLPPQSGCSPEAVEPHPQKGVIKFKSFKFYRRDDSLMSKYP